MVPNRATQHSYLALFMYLWMHGENVQNITNIFFTKYLLKCILSNVCGHFQDFIFNNIEMKNEKEVFPHLLWTSKYCLANIH